MILIAGVLGVLALFQPMIGLGRGPVSVDLSAYDLSFGLEKTHKVLDFNEKVLPGFATKRIPKDVLDTRDDIKLVADASKHAALAYVPAILLVLLGIVCVKQKRTPRVIGAVAGLLGLLSCAAWAGVRFALAYGIEEEPALGRLNFHAKFGAQVLLVVGVIAILAAAKSFMKDDA
jgi:hypothetical protein